MVKRVILGGTGILPVFAALWARLELPTTFPIRQDSACATGILPVPFGSGIVSSKKLRGGIQNKGWISIDFRRLRDVVSDARPKPLLGVLA